MAINKKYISQFFVGLMDGDGSIQVNHWRGTSLQFRLIIKLSNLPANHTMLIMIAKVVGGCVRFTNKNKNIIWVVNDFEEIQKIIKIFDIYPLLTGRKICQLKFMKKCLKNLNIDDYFANKDRKYDDIEAIINSRPFIKVQGKEYFKNWLAGFVEAEGCFSLRKKNNHSFSVSQKNEKFLLEAIKEILYVSNNLRCIKGPPSGPLWGNFYILEVYKRTSLIEIKHFFETHPLLGQKKESMDKFFKHQVFQ